MGSDEELLMVPAAEPARQGWGNLPLAEAGSKVLPQENGQQSP